MKISIISVFPQLHDQFLNNSLIKRAVESGALSFHRMAFSDVCAPKERIDEPTCGPGRGMIIRPEVVERAIEQCEKKWGCGYKVFFSPQGAKLSQPLFHKMKDEVHARGGVSAPKDGGATGDNAPHLILVCGRYEGMDERVEQTYADAVISIGDYVLMGGDIPAQVFLEGLLRLIPGIVGSQESVASDSFESPFLDYPQYGQPVEWQGKKVPDVVLSGDHEKIKQWRREQAAYKTVRRRFDWMRQHIIASEDKALAREVIPPHYVALMHTDVVVRGQGGKVGTTSITSLDIHDLSRSGATYGVENTFIVTPLKDQQAIMRTFLGFWLSSEGKDYNKSRYEAVRRVVPIESLAEVRAHIAQKEGKEPLVITTSAKTYDNVPTITYHDQGRVWCHDRPVLLVFGTGQGLSDQVMRSSDYVLGPITGLTEYNHLSVRSAVSVILDRWLGLNPHLT